MPRSCIKLPPPALIGGVVAFRLPDATKLPLTYNWSLGVFFINVTKVHCPAVAVPPLIVAGGPQ